MDTREAYDKWSIQYDENVNSTRDLEAFVLRETLKNKTFKHCLEIGCGTGKNTEWLMQIADFVTAVDLSEGMLQKAREKIRSEKVNFIHGDIIQDWAFTKHRYDLVVFSLVLEHIVDLDFIFKEASKNLVEGGIIYIGELHPFKQYAGSKARFITEEGEQIVDCFNHHITDFINAAKQFDLQLIDFHEYFDNNDRSSIPRILMLLFRK